MTMQEAKQLKRGDLVRYQDATGNAQVGWVVLADLHGQVVGDGRPLLFIWSHTSVGDPGESEITPDLTPIEQAELLCGCDVFDEGWDDPFQSAEGDS